MVVKHNYKHLQDNLFMIRKNQQMLNLYPHKLNQLDRMYQKNKTMKITKRNRKKMQPLLLKKVYLLKFNLIQSRKLKTPSI